MPKATLTHERQDDIYDVLTIEVAPTNIVSSLSLTAGQNYEIAESSRVSIDVSMVKDLGLYATITPDSGYSGGLEFTFELSKDGTNWYEDSGDTTIMENIVAGDTVAEVEAYVGSIPYVRVKKIHNTDSANGITINSLDALIKGQ